ncbi:MAG: TIGR00282 family metallophosphoesterase [Campylobacterota bacterium]|nr:TIGR00282 family metallophosphoesterase [Campylobacterota bacterium]
MRIAFIGDIVGRPGRKMVQHYLNDARKEFGIDCVIANGENASHGFGLTVKNSQELLKSGIDIITGGNHSFDKKHDMLALLETNYVLRPDNYPKGVPGSGLKILDINGESLAILNLMGVFTMPSVENPFNWAQTVVDQLHDQGIKNIFIDFHAEATSEKRIMHMMFKGRVSGICGTHTHIGTDDLHIDEGTCYLTDIGLTGCRDNVIGMDAKIPIAKATTSLGGHFEIPNNCKAIMQMMVMDIDDGAARDAFKIKYYSDNTDKSITKAFIE